VVSFFGGVLFWVFGFLGGLGVCGWGGVGCGGGLLGGGGGGWWRDFVSWGGVVFVVVLGFWGWGVFSGYYLTFYFPVGVSASRINVSGL